MARDRRVLPHNLDAEASILGGIILRNDVLLQLETLDRMRGAIKVFRGAGSSIQPSVPRERQIRGRVLDDPARATLPGYEEVVKRYYEKLADQ